MKEFYNKDCMEGMKEYPDKYFDLAIVDPPYGLNVQSMNFTKGVNSGSKRQATKRVDYRHSEWDIAPTKEYFAELYRVSKNQIIWGGNYFELPPSKSFICWDKERRGLDFADCEYAWCSDDLGVARVFTFMWNGMLQGDMKNKEKRFHPTQKPVALYKWILFHYAKEGDLILDTHVGSASSLIACEELGFDYVGYEIDETYYELAKERLDEFNAQIRMF